MKKPLQEDDGEHDLLGRNSTQQNVQKNPQTWRKSLMHMLLNMFES
jgi:hypothetical protein